MRGLVPSEPISDPGRLERHPTMPPGPIGMAGGPVIGLVLPHVRDRDLRRGQRDDLSVEVGVIQGFGRIRAGAIPITAPVLDLVHVVNVCAVDMVERSPATR